MDIVPSTLNLYNITKVAQKVAVGAAHAESAVVGSEAVLLVSSTDCHVRTGATPVAVTDDILLPAKVFLALVVNRGDKVSVIQDAAGGSLYIAELN